MFEEKYKNYVDANFTPRDDFEKLAKEMELKNMGNYTNKKHSNKGKYIALGVVVAVVAGASFFVVPALTTKTHTPDKVVTLSLDNSGLTNSNIKTLANTESKKSEISFAIDDEGRVLSVYGNDNIAKLVLVDEKLEGKNINDALKTVINVEINTGLIVKGNVTKDANSLEISVSAELSDEATQYLTDVKNTVTSYLEEQNIQAKVDEFTTMVGNEIDAKVKEIDPKADVKNMTYEDKIKVIAIHYVDASSLYGEALEDLYLDVKNYQIDFAEKEYTKEAIKEMTGLNELAKTAYLAAYDVFKTASDNLIEAINTTRYNLIVDESSAFQKAQDDLDTALMGLIKARNDLAKDKPAEDIKLSVQIAAFETAINALDAAEKGINKSCDALINLLNKADQALLDAQKVLFPENLEEKLNTFAQDSQDKLNQVKKDAFDNFEEAHKDDIAKAKADLKHQKELLIEAIKVA